MTYDAVFGHEYPALSKGDILPDRPANLAAMSRRPPNWSTRMTQITRTNPPTVCPPNGYTHGVLITAPARRLIMSGQIGITPDGNIPTDPATQIAQAFANLRAVLAAHDMTPANVVKVTSFLTDRAWLDAYRAARGAFFPTEPPASTLLFVAGLFAPALGFEIEAEAIA
jgi:enamine deaminase RidA (YjgF/YER057c/UK114 family)